MLTRTGLRTRLTLVATVLMAVGLVLGSLLVVHVLRSSLLSSIDRTARARAADVAVLAETEQLATVIALPPGTATVQLLDADARVVSASPGSDHLVPLVSGEDLADVRAGGTVEVSAARTGTGDRLHVVGANVGDRTVLVGTSVLAVDASLDVVRTAVLVVAPLLLLGFATACWLLVGSALRPVSALRDGAEQIAATGVQGRLPVPAARDELRRLAETLNGMLERLEAASARQLAFVADAAHELRSPLASVRTQLEVARLHPSAADWEGTADEVLEDVERLSRLVADLLLLARLDDTRAPAAAAQRVELAALARTLAGRSPFRVPVTVSADEAIAVDADYDGLDRALRNLVDNAVRHARTAVTVRVSGDDSDAVVEVVDDGPGIAPADRERVFTRFTRLDAARTGLDGGSGLGLAIVRDLLHAYGGTVTLSDAQPGVRAVVRLPRAPGNGLSRP